MKFLMFPSPFSFLLRTKKNSLNFSLLISSYAHSMNLKQRVKKTKNHNEIYGFSLASSGFNISAFCHFYLLHIIQQGLTTKKKISLHPKTFSQILFYSLVGFRVFFVCQINNSDGRNKNTFGGISFMS